MASPSLPETHALGTRPSRPAEQGPRCLFATFNASLNRNAAGDLVRDLSTGSNAEARTVAEIIQRVNPDVLLINEFDYVEGGRAAELFRDNYLRVRQNGAASLNRRFTAPVNTGVPE